MDKSKIVTVATFDSEVEAQIVKSLLEGAGIECSLLHDTMQSVLPLPTIIRIELTVAAKDEKRAREVLAAKFDPKEFAQATGTVCKVRKTSK